MKTRMTGTEARDIINASGAASGAASVELHVGLLLCRVWLPGLKC